MSSYNPYNRYACECADKALCWKASCMQVHAIPGTFVQGRGYVSLYRDGPRHVCMTRERNGCPDGATFDAENARCCYRPSYTLRGKAPVRWKTCETCGNEVPDYAAKALNKLPTLPGVPCRHENLRPWTIAGWFECDLLGTPTADGKLPGCGGIWTHRPEPFEPPEKTWDDMVAESKERVP